MLFRKPHHQKLGTPTSWISKIHQVRVKSKKGTWKSVSSIHEITMHDIVRLANKPHVEGEVRHIDIEKKRVEFSHHGRPTYAPVHKIKVLIRKKYRL